MSKRLNFAMALKAFLLGVVMVVVVFFGLAMWIGEAKAADNEFITIYSFDDTASPVYMDVANACGLKDEQVLTFEEHKKVWYTNNFYQRALRESKTQFRNACVYPSKMVKITRRPQL